MDQQPHTIKTEAHPYHTGYQVIQTHDDGRAYDPECPICRECALPPVSELVERRAYRPGPVREVRQYPKEGG